MSIVDFPGYVPCLTASIRGSKSHLCPKIITPSRPSLSVGDRGNRVLLPDSIDRRGFLKMGAIGAASTGLALSGLGAPRGGACYAQAQAFAPIIYGIGSVAVEEVVKEVFKPALQHFSENVFKPWFEGKVEPLAQEFLDWVSGGVESFLHWLYKWTKALLGDDVKEKFNDGKADTFALRDDKQIPLGKKIRGIGFETGFIKRAYPRDINIAELHGMHEENVLSLRLPLGRRIDYKTYQEEYKGAFKLINELYHKKGEEGFKEDQVDYLVPLIHPGDGKEYLGFAIKNRHPATTKKLENSFVTNWVQEEHGDDGKLDG